MPYVSATGPIGPAAVSPIRSSNGRPRAKSIADNGSLASRILYRDLRTRPLMIERALGNYYELQNGRKIFDASGGAAVSNLGHGDKRIIDAGYQQWLKIDYAPTATFTTDVAEAYAFQVAKSTGWKLELACFYSSGTEGTEASLKMARQYFQEKAGAGTESKRTKFIGRKQSYHGASITTLALGGHVARKEPFQPMLSPLFSHVSPCYPYRYQKDGESDDDYVQKLEEELRREFIKQGKDEVCAFVMEPIVGATLGCVGCPAGYLAAVRKVCDEFGALLVFDEIMCGMGRTGKLHAWQWEGVAPDILILGKGLGAGYASISAIVVAPKVASVLRNGSGCFAHGHTYQNYPAYCAVGLEVLRIITEENLMKNVEKQGELLEGLLRRRIERHAVVGKYVGEIRGKGHFWGIEFVMDKATKEPFPKDYRVAWALQEKGLEAGYEIYFYPGSGTKDGTLGDHIILAPAFNVTEEDVHQIVNRLEKVCVDFFSELEGRMAQVD